MEMRFCMRCGAELTVREHPTDGLVTYCEACGDYRFPVYSTAISAVVLNPERTHILLIRQYGEPHDVLPAGYVDKGETAEAALLREVREELGMTARRPRFLGSHYYAPSQTLMLNFLAGLEEDEASPNAEVDAWEWLPVSEARARVKPGGLARILLDQWDGSPIVNP